MKYDNETATPALQDSQEGLHATLHSSEEGDFLMAFGPADHHFESDGDSEEACFYVLGYN